MICPYICILVKQKWVDSDAPNFVKQFDPIIDPSEIPLDSFQSVATQIKAFLANSQVVECFAHFFKITSLSEIYLIGRLDFITQSPFTGALNRITQAYQNMGLWKDPNDTTILWFRYAITAREERLSLTRIYPSLPLRALSSVSSSPGIVSPKS